jgi:hypothetical protein
LPIKKDNEYILANINELQILFPLEKEKKEYYLSQNTKYHSYVELDRYEFNYDTKSRKIKKDFFYFDSGKLVINRIFDSIKDLLLLVPKELKNSRNEHNDERTYKLSFPSELNEVCYIDYHGKNLFNVNNPLINSLNFSYKVNVLSNSLSSIRSMSPGGYWFELMKGDVNIFQKIITKAINDIGQLFDNHPEMNILFNYCEIVSNSIFNILNANIHNFNKEGIVNHENIDLYVLDRLSNMNIHSKLIEYLSTLPERENKLKFITIRETEDRENKREIFILKTISTEGVEIIDSKDTIFDLLDSVNDEWRFELIEAV